MTLRRISPFIVAACALSSLVPIGQNSSASTPVTVTLQPGLTLTIPAGWGSGSSASSRLGQHSLLLWNGESSIFGTGYLKSAISVNSSDFRRPSYFARNWSRTWGLPLFRWATDGPAQIEETDRAGHGFSECLIGADLPGVEFEFHAWPGQGGSLAASREAVQKLLSSATGAELARHRIPGLDTGAPRLLPVSGFGRAAIDAFDFDGLTLKMPSGWYPDQVCRVFSTPELEQPHFAQLMRPSQNNARLHINWFTPQDGAVFKYWQARLPFSLTEPAPKGAVVRYLPLTPNQEIQVETDSASSTPDRKPATYYRFGTGNILLYAHGLFGAGPIQASSDKAVTTIFRQIMGMPVSKQDVTQNPKDSYP